jgi:hypothetical protein
MRQERRDVNCCQHSPLQPATRLTMVLVQNPMLAMGLDLCDQQGVAGKHKRSAFEGQTVITTVA